MCNVGGERQVEKEDVKGGGHYPIPLAIFIWF